MRTNCTPRRSRWLKPSRHRHTKPCAGPNATHYRHRTRLTPSQDRKAAVGRASSTAPAWAREFHKIKSRASWNDVLADGGGDEEPPTLCRTVSPSPVAPSIPSAMLARSSLPSVSPPPPGGEGTVGYLILKSPFGNGPVIPLLSPNRSCLGLRACFFVLPGQARNAKPGIFSCWKGARARKVANAG